VRGAAESTKRRANIEAPAVSTARSFRGPAARVNTVRSVRGKKEGVLSLSGSLRRPQASSEFRRIELGEEELLPGWRDHPKAHSTEGPVEGRRLVESRRGKLVVLSARDDVVCYFIAYLC